ncbi:MAG TPA: SAM-dependent methyltransferase [Streptosporangiaceae bacterium]|nr:SAM-dependent methyltransferase [Streptosporangiaceae bacterium]
MTADSPAPPLDTSVAHSARVWNYWLGGKDNYQVDRETGDRVAELYPDIVLLAQAARGFLARAVGYLAADAGVRQFLDIGTGLPTASNTHQIAQAAAPDSRVVYVDNDPVVLAHARALLTSSPQGATDYLDADLRDTGAILQAASRTLDFTRPAAITLIAILHHISDYGQARSIVNRLMDAVPSGSYLAIAHSTNVIYGAASDEAVARWNKFGKPPVTLRSPQEISRFFDGLDLLPPGLVSTTRWQPGHAGTGSEGREVDQFCGLARKP